MMLTPYQICPEHLHPQLGDYQGKEETFRCRWGEVYLYVPGEPTEQPRGRVPEHRKEHFTVWHEIYLRPGEQYTLKEQTRHWFQAGPEGAVVSEFSTPSFDEADIFIDPEIKREIIASWDRLFDDSIEVNSNQKYGTVWEIRKEWITNVIR